LLYEEALRGSAGTLAALAKDWKAATSPIYVYYGDIVCDADLAVLGQALEGSGALGAILVHQRQRPQSIVEMAPDGRVTQFLERPKLAPDYQEKHWTFSGIAAFSTGIFERLPAHCPADLPADVFPTLAREGTLVAVGYEGRRVAVDSVERLALANRLWGNPDSGATAH
jgi:NDP-sugar pyrophosphorylase family protein